MIKGMAKHPVTVMILARLAVDVQHQGIGLGKALRKDALLRTAQAADIAGIRAPLTHALAYFRVLLDDCSVEVAGHTQKRPIRAPAHPRESYAETP